jgi:hypothetical protein
MTVVSSKEFVKNEDKYLDMAASEEVFIQRGNGMYHLMYRPLEIQYPEQVILEPDGDLHRAITMDDLLERTYGVIDKFFADK